MAKQVLEALRHTILKLQSDLSTSREAAKRVKTVATPAPAAGSSLASTSSAVPSATATKALVFKHKSQVKAMFDGLKKGIKAEKLQGASKG